MSDAPSKPQTAEERHAHTERLYRALKVRLSTKIVAGEDVSFAELEKLEKLELRLANMEQYFRLRALFKTTDEPCADARPSRSSKRSGKATQGRGRSPSPST